MIVTFYSYKGGVGRSMAMANVADILARRGARVLMIDFDLEAPGLEQYFQIHQPSARRHLGLLDLLLEFNRETLPAGFRPLRGSEVGRSRAQVLADPLKRRRELWPDTPDPG